MTAMGNGGSVLVDVLQANDGRSPGMVRLKLKRMAENSFAFFRGACPLFAAAWGDLKPADPGPEILLCGDLHLENFGAFRDDAGETLYDINDFDEALTAPSALDPVRCATSILLAAELWKLSPLHANGLVLAYLDEYRNAVTADDHVRLVDAAAPRLARGPIREILGKTAMGTQGDLLDRQTERLKNGTRRIVRSRKRHPGIDPARAGEILDAVREYGRARGEAEFYRAIDVTGRVVGIGSLGVERYLALVSGGGSAETNRLFDIKEERPSALLRCSSCRAEEPAARSEAARVVHAQRTLQARPTAGLDVIPIGGKEYRVREMIPEENRSSLDRFHEKPAKLLQAITSAGRLTGLAHLRGATSEEGRDATPDLRRWATGPALDSVLAAAARYAERTRLAFRQFRAERRAPDALPEALRKRVGR